MTTQETEQELSLAEDLAANVVSDEPLEEEAAVEETQEAEAIQEAIEALEAPPKWDKRYKEVFSEWANPQFEKGREWQEAMLELYNEGQGYTTKVEQERAALRQQYEQAHQYAQQWNNVLSPYQQLVTELGTTPDAIVRQGMGLLQSLRNNPQQTIARLAREANVDMQSALSEQPWQSPESKQIEELKRELTRMQQGSLQREQRQAQERIQQIRAENTQRIQAFTEATDESGNLLHPHIDAVQETMAQLIYGRENLRRSNPGLPAMELAEAYEQACKLNPDITGAQVKEAEAAKLAKEAAEAKKAKSVAKRVPSGRTGKETPKQSLRDTIRENLVAA